MCFDPKKKNLTWFATRLWVITMDGLALGPIVMILTCYMWQQTKKIVGEAVKPTPRHGPCSVVSLAVKVHGLHAAYCWKSIFQIGRGS